MKANWNYFSLLSVLFSSFLFTLVLFLSFIFLFYYFLNFFIYFHQSRAECHAKTNEPIYWLELAGFFCLLLIGVFPGGNSVLLHRERLISRVERKLDNNNSNSGGGGGDAENLSFSEEEHLNFKRIEQGMIIFSFF